MPARCIVKNHRVSRSYGKGLKTRQFGCSPKHLPTALFSFPIESRGGGHVVPASRIPSPSSLKIFGFLAILPNNLQIPDWCIFAVALVYCMS